MANFEEYIEDPYTGELALIKSNDRYLFLQKKEKKIEMWQKRKERSDKQQEKVDMLNEANLLNEKAKNDFIELYSILRDTLENDDRLDWNELKDFKRYKNFKSMIMEPKLETYLNQVPKKLFIEIFFTKMRIKRESLEMEVKQNYEADLEKYNAELIVEKKRHETEKENFYCSQKQHNEDVDKLKNDFEKGEAEAIENYLEYVFDRSKYPESISLQYETFYVSDRRTLIVNVDLPAPESLPTIIEYKYVQAKNEIIAKEIKKSDFKKMYEEIIAQITIRTIHEAFESLYVNHADFVVLNGFVDSIDKKTGNPLRSCIVSIQAEKEYFESIKLKNIDAMDCIKGMKGLIASEFINLAPVRPILNLNRNDKRIIESDEIIDSFDLSNNLAEMEWQKFEVLVRDLFSKEFSGDGVEVRVTQASRDAGVDAIIFDPDPIKGGKFVVQAKRYNNVVGVSAVRDLYGTMINEGAVKGILVTTSYFGKDSIEFAKDKPLALLSGAELIHMFNKHGYKVSITTKKK